MRDVKKKDNQELLSHFADLHTHLRVQRKNFVNITGMLGDSVIHLLYIA
jgi:hypothetical protein